MSNPLRVNFRVGEIEFSAEGDPSDVEHERIAFLEKLLPMAVDAISRGNQKEPNDIHNDVSILSDDENSPIAQNQPALLLTSELRQPIDNISVNEFIQQKGFVSTIDIALGLLFYYQGQQSPQDETGFSSTDLRNFFRLAKIKPPSNCSDVLGKLSVKGRLRNSNMKGKFILTQSGTEYIAKFAPSQKVSRPSASKKARKSTPSEFSAIDIKQELIDKYPSIDDFDKFKDKMLFALGLFSLMSESFTFSANDVLYILENKFNQRVTIDMITGVFGTMKNCFIFCDSSNTSHRKKRRLSSAGQQYFKKIAQNNENH